MQSELLDWLSALNDSTRLRILHLLEREELGVGEIARIIQLPQSTVSRHLKQLLESGWVTRRPAGTASMYRFIPSAMENDARSLWTVARQRLHDDPETTEDVSRLEEVLRERQTDTREFFGRIGGEWDALRHELFGEEFTAEALLALLDPDWIIADIGCGTGNAAELLAPHVKKIIAIDREKAMLDAARKRLAAFRNIEFKRGDFETLPLETESVDAAIVFLVLHHIEDPAAAVTEVARVLDSGGVLLIVDMIAHSREMYRHTMGHVHLGFSQRDLRSWAKAAGLATPRYHRLRPDTEGKGPGLFVATMRKRAAAAKRSK